MLVELGDDDNKQTNGMIDRDVVKEMVSAYRGRIKNQNFGYLMYAHFSLKEMLQLFIDNGALSEGALDHLNPDPANSNGYGVKIYIGNHTKDTNCPSQRPDYVGKDTAIVCVTEVKDIKTYRYMDILKNKKKILMSSNTDSLNDGTALDQSSTYPPDNPNIAQPAPVPTDLYDIGN